MTWYNPPLLETQDPGLVTTTQPFLKTLNATNCEEVAGDVQGMPVLFFYFLITNYSISSNLSKLQKQAQRASVRGQAYIVCL